jgi:hypothetical protein
MGQANVKRGEEGGAKKYKSAKDLGRELLRAAEKGDVESLRELLQCEGVDVRNHEEGNGFGGPRTALIAACERGHVEVARVLLDHGGETKQEVEAALCWAAGRGHVEVVKMLMERGVDPSAQVNTPVCWAARHGHIDIVKLLLQDERVNPAAHDNHAVYIAAWNGCCDVVKVLLSDSRVNGTRAIPGALPRAVHILIEDERCGIHTNRGLFLKYCKETVARYDELVEERTARICAVSWVMKVIGNGWGDLREPTEERMAKQPVNWEGK